MLTLDSFRKFFSNHLILDIPSTTFEKGVHWVKGKNGSGKSTLFNCLAGLLPYSGHIKLEDIDLRKSPEAYKLKVNYSQSEPIYPEFLTGSDLIQFYVKLKKSSREQVEELDQLLGVSTYKNQPCGNFSSGMMKKLSILLAFLGNPEWIILDEPLITLDKESQIVVSELIRSRAKNGVSFLFATHQDFENSLINPDNTWMISNQTLESEL